MRLTRSEQLFEEFCRINRLEYERVAEGPSPTPDYTVDCDGQMIAFEVKQIDKDENFNRPVSQRTVGDHLRAKIASARKQVGAAAELGQPAVLLVMNNLDPLQPFGTEPTDYWAAMHGDLEVVLSDARHIVRWQRGRNREFRPDKNGNFSGLGHLRHSRAGPQITIYENALARFPLGRLPRAFAVERSGS